MWGNAVGKVLKYTDITIQFRYSMQQHIWLFNNKTHRMHSPEINALHKNNNQLAGTQGVQTPGTAT